MVSLDILCELFRSFCSVWRSKLQRIKVVNLANDFMGQHQIGISILVMHVLSQGRFIFRELLNDSLELAGIHPRISIVIHWDNCCRPATSIQNTHFAKLFTFLKNSAFVLFSKKIPHFYQRMAFASVIDKVIFVVFGQLFVLNTDFFLRNAKIGFQMGHYFGKQSSLSTRWHVHFVCLFKGVSFKTKLLAQLVSSSRVIVNRRCGLSGNKLDCRLYCVIALQNSLEHLLLNQDLQRSADQF